MEALALVALLIGGMIGYVGGASKPEPVKKETRRPIEWQPKEHQDSMLMCKTMCTNKVFIYDILTGKCQCK